VAATKAANSQPTNLATTKTKASKSSMARTHFQAPEAPDMEEAAPDTVVATKTRYRPIIYEEEDDLEPRTPSPEEEQESKDEDGEEQESEDENGGEQEGEEQEQEYEEDEEEEAGTWYIYYNDTSLTTQGQKNCHGGKFLRRYILSFSESCTNHISSTFHLAHEKAVSKHSGQPHDSARVRPPSSPHPIVQSKRVMLSVHQELEILRLCIPLKYVTFCHLV
jgi:hypothetical protein